MNRNLLSVSLLTLLTLSLAACGSKRDAAFSGAGLVKDKIVGPNVVHALPKATVFKMSGPYADNVAITLNPDGTLLYYPDPSDISASSAPVALEDGWYLNRQGIGANSVFTSFTFEQYAALEKVPSREELLEAVIPDAKVTEFMELPIGSSEAMADPALCIQYLK